MTANGGTVNNAIEQATHPDRWIRAQGRGINVGPAERAVSAIGGAALLAFSLSRGRLRWMGLPVSAALLYRGITGNCPLNTALGRNSAIAHGGHTSPVSSVERGEGRKVERSVIVERPVAELYAFWRDFTNLPAFMEHLKAVTVLDDRRSHWVARGPGGSNVEWDAEIHNEIENELIAWRSLPGADVANAGSVHFRELPAGRGTEVRVVLSYEPPAGELGVAIAKLFGEEPSQQVRDALRRFKQLMEAEGATNASQPVGE